MGPIATKVAHWFGNPVTRWGYMVQELVSPTAQWYTLIDRASDQTPMKKARLQY